jgi:hypothetical protein
MTGVEKQAAIAVRHTETGSGSTPMTGNPG